MPQEQQWVFSPFRLDPANACLWRDTDAMALPPKVFAVLDHLVRNAGRLVTKEELLDTVWQRRFVGESVLKGCINELRKALCDDPKAPRYIATVAKRGYRFIAAVREIGSSGDGRGGDGAGVAFAAPERGVHPEAAYWVGREGSLSRLQGMLQNAVGGQSQLIFITGEAGIGKTTLVEMFMEQLPDAGLGVLWGQCIEHYGAGEAFLPLLQALAKRCRAVGGQEFIAKLRHYAPTWLAQMPWTLAAEDRETLQREVLGATKERMLRELCELLQALCRETPLVLVLEDLHWSDHATLDFIALLGRRRERAALLVIGTYRPVEVILQGHRLKAVKQELEMHALCSELALDALAAAEVVAYLARRFPAGEIPEVLAPIVYRRTEGHLLFMVNLVEYLLAQGRIAQKQGRWTLGYGDEGLDAIPESLRQMIEYQIERLSPEEQRLLGAASAAGAEWSAALLAAALGVDAVQIECSCEALARRGQMLTSAGVEEWPDGTVAGRYAFLHALYAEVLYQRLTPAQRVELHGCLGKRLESAYGERAGEIAAELALHFEQGRDPVRGVRYLRQAAEHAARRFANREAIGYLERALDLVERLPGAGRIEQRIDLLQQRGWVRRSMGDVRGAAEDLSAVLSNAREANQRLAEVRALLELSRIYGWVDRRRSLELAEQAVARSDDLPDALMKALVRGNCASLNILFRGWREEDARACRLSLEVTRQAQNPRMQIRRLIILAILEYTSSNYQAARVAAEEGMQVAQGLGDAYLFMVCQAFRAWALLHVGAWGEMRRSFAAASITAERNGTRRASTYYRLEIGWLHAEALDFEGARSGCEQSVESALQAHDLGSYFLGQNLLAKANLGLQDYRRAFECFKEITRRVEDEGLLMDSFLHPPFHQGLCEYWLAQGDLG